MGLKQYKQAPGNSNQRGQRERGAKLVVIDPRVTSYAEEADIHAQLRPGTDGALALGMLNVIIKEGLYDKEFVEKWSIEFEKVRISCSHRHIHDANRRTCRHRASSLHLP
nr:hypothetical protein BSM_25600 [uncultured archaeon]